MMNLHVLKKIQVSHGIFYGILLKGVTLNFLEHVCTYIWFRRVHVSTKKNQVTSGIFKA